MAKQVFRQAALNSLATPEQLDKTLRVTDPKGWLALVGLLLLIAGALVWGFFGSISTVMQGGGILIRQGGIQELKSEQTGILTSLSLKAGDTLVGNQTIGKLRTSAGTEVELHSQLAGTILEVLVEPGSEITPGSVMARLEMTALPLQGVIFVPLAEGKTLQIGREVHLIPSTVKVEDYGYIFGTISYVSQYPVSSERLQLTLKNKELVDALLGNGPVTEVDVSLTGDNTASGFKWSSGSGPDQKITGGTPCTASLILGQQSPISLIFSNSKS